MRIKSGVWDNNKSNPASLWEVGLLGYGLAFVHSEGYKVTSANGEISHDSEDETDGGIQLGLGLQYNLTDNWFLAGEYKYQPGILGDGHVVMGSIGFKF